MQDVLGGRALAAAVELFEWIDARDGGASLLHNIMAYTLQVDRPTPEFMAIFAYTILVVALDESVLVPFAHFLARVVDPLRAWDVEGFPEWSLVVHGVVLLDATAEADPDLRIIELVRNGLTPDATGTSPIGVVGEVIRQVNRVVPGGAGPTTAADYDAVFDASVVFMRDDVRGMERLYGFIETAMYGEAGKPVE